jgi:hypothetical protein
MALKNYQQRVRSEKYDLDAKIARGRAFLEAAGRDDSPAPEDDLVRLKAQLEAMDLYSQALAERIRFF